jgi:hypothetical protein
MLPVGFEATISAGIRLRPRGHWYRHIKDTMTINVRYDTWFHSNGRYIKRDKEGKLKAGNKFRA